MKVNKDIIAVVIAAIFLIEFLVVSINTPVIFGDEGYHAYIGKWIAENGLIPKYDVMWETAVWHTKHNYPPLFHFYTSAFWMIGGLDALKLLSPIFAVLAGLMVYLFMKKIKHENAGLISMIILFCTPMLVTYSVLAYTDILLTLLFACFAYALLNWTMHSEKKYIILTAIFATLASLTKATGIITFFIVLIYFIINTKRLKELLIFILISALLIMPWFLQSMILYDYNPTCFGPIYFALYSNVEPINQPKDLPCGPDISANITKIPELQFAGRNEQTGTEASVWSIGLLSFLNFSFGWVVMFLFIFALIFFLYEKKDNVKDIFLAWMFAFALIFFMATKRAEDTARYILPVIIPISIICGLFISKLYSTIKNRSAIMAALLIIILIPALLFFGVAKANTMLYVKQFSPAFFDACDWIKTNTPENSTLFATYSQQTAITCMRRASTGGASAEEIQLTENDTSYEHLKLHGFNYVFIPQNMISRTPYKESLYIGFVNYIQNSDKFKLVYENTQTFGQNSVLIYQVL